MEIDQKTLRRALRARLASGRGCVWGRGWLRRRAQRGSLRPCCSASLGGGSGRALRPWCFPCRCAPAPFGSRALLALAASRRRSVMRRFAARRCRLVFSAARRGVACRLRHRASAARGAIKKMPRHYWPRTRFAPVRCASARRPRFAMLLSLLWSLLLPLCASRACGCRRFFARALRSPCVCGCAACGVLRLAARSRPALAPTHSSVARPVATLRFALRRAPCGGCPCRRVPRALPVRCPRCARRSGARRSRFARRLCALAPRLRSRTCLAVGMCGVAWGFLRRFGCLFPFFWLLGSAILPPWGGGRFLRGFALLLGFVFMHLGGRVPLVSGVSIIQISCNSHVTLM